VELESTAKVYFTGPRTYDRTLGRFLQPDPLTEDPLRPTTLNPYSYASNNPILLKDPSGYSTTGTLGGAFTAALATAATMNPMIGAAVGGFMGGFISVMESGNLSTALAAGGSNAAIGALTAGVGEAFPLLGYAYGVGSTVYAIATGNGWEVSAAFGVSQLGAAAGAIYADTMSQGYYLLVAPRAGKAGLAWQLAYYFDSRDGDEVLASGSDWIVVKRVTASECTLTGQSIILLLMAYI
jgi:RHS repeat-associated protein